MYVDVRTCTPLGSHDHPFHLVASFTFHASSLIHFEPPFVNASRCVTLLSPRGALLSPASPAPPSSSSFRLSIPARFSPPSQASTVSPLLKIFIYFQFPVAPLEQRLVLSSFFHRLFCLAGIFVTPRPQECLAPAQQHTAQRLPLPLCREINLLLHSHRSVI